MTRQVRFWLHEDGTMSAMVRKAKDKLPRIVATKAAKKVAVEAVAVELRLLDETPTAA